MNIDDILKKAQGFISGFGNNVQQFFGGQQMHSPIPQSPPPPPPNPVQQMFSGVQNFFQNQAMNNINQTNQGLQKWGQIVDTVVNKPFDRIGADIQRAKSQLPSDMNEFQQGVNLLPTAASSIGNNLYRDIPVVGPASSYIGNRIVNPLVSIPSNFTNAVTDAQKGNWLGAGANTGMGVLNTLVSIGNVVNPLGTQEAMAPFLGLDVAKGSLLARRQGMNPQDTFKSQLQAFTGENVPGAGETLTDNPKLAKGIDVAEQVAQFAIPAYHGIKGYFKNKQIQADAIKSFSDEVKNVIHPINMDESVPPSNPPPNNPLINAFKPIFNLTDETVKGIRDIVGGFQENPNVDNTTRLQLISKQYLNADSTSSPKALSNVWNYLLSIRDGEIPKTVPKDLLPLHNAIISQYSKGSAYPDPNNINVGFSTKEITPEERAKLKQQQEQPPVQGGVNYNTERIDAIIRQLKKAGIKIDEKNLTKTGSNAFGKDIAINDNLFNAVVHTPQGSFEYTSSTGLRPIESAQWNQIVDEYKNMKYPGSDVLSKSSTPQGGVDLAKKPGFIQGMEADKQNQVYEPSLKQNIDSSVPQETIDEGVQRVNKTGEPPVPPSDIQNPQIARVAADMASPAREYGQQNRDLTKTFSGRSAVGQTYADVITKEIKTQVPKLEDRQAIFNWIDAPEGQKPALDPKLQSIANDIRSLYLKAKGYLEENSPNFKGIGDGEYTMHIPEEAQGKKQSIYASRTIAKFIPEGGGEPLVGNPDYLHLKPTGEDGMFMDENGKSYEAVRATAAEKTAATGIKYKTDIADVLGKYTQSFFQSKEYKNIVDNLKTNDIYSDKVLPSSQEAPKGYRTIQMKGMEGYYVEPHLADWLEAKFKPMQQEPAIVRMYRGAEDAATRSIFYNFITHPLNQLTNALIGSGRNTGPLGMVKLVGNMPEAISDIQSGSPEFVDWQKAGGNFGGLGGASKEPGLFQKLAMKVTDNPGILKVAGGIDTLNPLRQLYRVNNAITSGSDDVLRLSLYKTLEDGGMSKEQAVSVGDKFMTDYGNTAGFEKSVSRNFAMFWPYLKAQLGIGVDMIRHPITNAGTIMNAGLLFAASMALEQGWKQLTGNPQATVRKPGFLGLVNSVAKTPSEVMSGEIPSLLTTHIGKPIMKEGLQQLFNKDLYTRQDIVQQGSTTPILDRLKHLSNVFAPNQQINPVLQGKKSIGELLANYAGLYTPHVGGYQAAPNIPALNVDNAKPGTGQSIKDYFAAVNAVTSTLNPNQLSIWNTLHPQKKDSNGNIIFVKGADQTAQAANIYLNNPDIVKAEIALNAKLKAQGQITNPIWDLTPGQRAFVWGAQAHLPGMSNAYTKAIYNQPWYPAYQQQLQQYFASIKASPGATQQTDTYPQASPRVQQLLSQKPRGYYNDPEVQAYFNKVNAYNNSKLTAMGLAPLAGTSSGGGSSFWKNLYYMSKATNNMKNQNRNFKYKQRTLGKNILSKTKFKGISLGSIKPKKMASVSSMFKVGKLGTKKSGFKIAKIGSKFQSV